MGLETILPDLTNSTTEAEFQKKWESLTFTDNFIFSHVMHDEDICRQVAEGRFPPHLLEHLRRRTK